ncbi:MAG: hypothetical protein E6377_18025 [Clostridium sp.]|uniref:LuxR C-terminal-related transcriptional regulator n=1 Tax=Clostridium TaxID=1485 RepID=UPI002330F6AB|nr:MULTISPECIES: hypothetical protein [Clostridium]MBS6888618.1 hypothetical protein [Clostridium sp.]MDB2122260.1 hypothetical protein [Clostridium paraputrificum]MDU4725917.1 hypothetical protein [Clostridium sp.]MDU6876334.1 hypothetical protein [Clostridium sp.]MDU6937378.1 hypothetical protein [Clostridium sp.]
MAKSKWEEVSKRLKDVETWASMGLSEKQIAKNLGISKSTMENYKNDHLDFLDSLNSGKRLASYEVENAVYKKATGYKVKKTAAIKCKDTYYDENGNKCIKERVEVVEYEEEVPADIQAAKFWLVNKKSAKWSDNPAKIKIDKEALQLKKDMANKESW